MRLFTANVSSFELLIHGQSDEWMTALTKFEMSKNVLETNYPLDMWNSQIQTQRRILLRMCVVEVVVVAQEMGIIMFKSYLPQIHSKYCKTRS